MGFRDETEAQRERIVRLEQELSVATAERDEASRELDAARGRLKRLSDLESENTALRAGVLPGARRARMLTVLVAAVGVIGFVAMLLANRADMAAADARLADSEESYRRERERRTAAESALEAEPRRVPLAGPDMEAALLGAALDLDPREIRSLRFDGARVLEVQGEADVAVGDGCTVSVRARGAEECALEARCDGVEIYPGEGHGGFDCTRDGVVWVGSDIHFSSVSGDPRLELDGNEGSLVVADGPFRPWSVTIALGDPS